MNLGPAALADIPPAVGLPWAVPVLADKAYDSDPLRDQLVLGGSGCWRGTARTGRSRR